MNPITSVRTVETRPQNYAVENESEVSDAFMQSLAINGTDGIVAPTPVQYANAQRSESGNRVSDLDSTQVNQFYNDIASGYQGMSTSYDASGTAGQYAMIGSNIDLYA